MPSVPFGFSGNAFNKFTIRVTNSEALFKKIDAYGVKAERQVRLGLNVALITVEAKAKQLIRTGYYRPAYNTGILIKSVTSHILKATRGYVEGEIGTAVHYGIYVHEGTWFMKRRPFLVDALHDSRKQIVHAIKLAFGLNGVI